MILVGSSYFFKKYPDFKSKDIDYVKIVDNPIGFKKVRQISIIGKCIFEWKRLPPEEYIRYSLVCSCPMSIGKFFVPEFANEIGFTVEHLKQLEPIINNLDDKHKYYKPIYDSYIKNNGFILEDSYRDEAYRLYKEARTHGN